VAVTPRTVFLAKLLGLYFILFALVLSAHKQESLVTLGAIVHSPDILLVTGAFALVGALAMLIGHNIWRGGAPVVVVTIIGWILFFKAFLLLFLPSDVLGFVYDMIRVDKMFTIYMLITAAVGVYLTYVGFTVKPRASDGP
jgi:hypothetical protein